MRGRECVATRGDTTTSLHKTTRGRRSERTTRDVSSHDHNCSDDSNNDSNSDASSGNGDSGGNNSNSNSGGRNSNSGGKNNNQLKPAAQIAATAVNAALASIILAS
jgi:hypothetical protein